MRKINKKIIYFALILCMLLPILLAQSVFAAFDDSYLTWDDKPATLSEISVNLGYGDYMVDANGNYKPLYYDAAKELWERGLMLGSDGTFNLDKPLTRTEGVIMTLRLLGKEQEAINAQLPCSFRDVPEWAQAQVAYAAANGITTGYSATVFGANDPMSANQYITFALRAMGYRDNEDFVWNRAAEFALEIGMIGEPCKEQYMRSNLFLRDNVAVLSYNALFRAKSKNGTMLGDNITARRPVGTIPYATAAQRDAGEVVTTVPGALGEADITSIGGFNLLGSTTIDVGVTCTVSGAVTVSASHGSSSAGITLNMVKGSVYTIRFHVNASLGSGNTNLTNRTIIFSTSSGSSRSATAFGIAPTITRAELIQ